LGDTLIPDEIISEIRERVDIAALIGEHIELKRRGASYVGICPFHPEKTPSFHVNRARQFYHCFGCQESGDVVSFVMKFEGRTFPEAVAMLAERAGIELREQAQAEDAASKRDKARRDRLYGLMETAAAFYQERLQDHRHGERALEELRHRSVQPETAAAFRLGYAPDAWDELERFLRTKGCSLAEAAETGLVVAKREGSGYYDRFRNRLMFPVFDVQGRVVAFSGRTLAAASADQQEAKYLNSPESQLFSKGSLLFGMHQARLEIRRKGYAILCEGNFDLIALHQNGFSNAVAPLGTAFTELQAKLLRRFCDRIVLMFDSDLAGHKAVASAYPLLTAVGISARVVDLPPGHDPDSFLREKGRDTLVRLVDEAPGVVEFLIDLAAGQRISGAAEVSAAIGKLAPVLAQVESPVERHKYIEHIAKRFEIRDLQIIRRELNRSLRNYGTQRNQQAADVSLSKAMAHKASDSASFPSLECELIGAFFDFPELFGQMVLTPSGPRAESVGSSETNGLDDVADKLSLGLLEELLTSPLLRSIFEQGFYLFKEKGALIAHELVEKLEPELEGSLAFQWLRERLVVQKFGSVLEAKSAVVSGIRQLRKENIERKFRLLAGMISEARRKGDDDLALVLSNQQVALTRDARSVVQGLKR
jgi:DNA primase